MDTEVLAKKLVDKLYSGDPAGQRAAAEQIRDLCAERPAYRLAFDGPHCVQALACLLDKSCGLEAAQALAILTENEESLRSALLLSGGLEPVIAALGAALSGPLAAELPKALALVSIVAAVAAEAPGREALLEQGGVPLAVRLLGEQAHPEVQERATQAVCRLAHSPAAKVALRAAGVFPALLKLLPSSPARTLQGQGSAADAVAGVADALTVLVARDELGQDTVRDLGGVALLVAQLDGRRPEAVVAVLDTVRALIKGNEANMDVVREAWGLPLLVKLLGPEAGPDVHERAVDCLRVMAAASPAARAALVANPVAVPALIALLRDGRPESAMVERAAAVVGYLAEEEEGAHQQLREAGALHHLIRLMGSGPEERVTEVAVRALVQLTREEKDRTSVRLAGGIPPLVKLLMQRANPRVLAYAEEALTRLSVSGAERNAMLDTFRYLDTGGRNESVGAPSIMGESLVHPVLYPEDAPPEPLDESRPFTRYTVSEVCELLADLGFQPEHTAVFRANGVTGGDLLSLQEPDLRALGLTPLLVRKVLHLQQAFETFSRIQQSPTGGELTIWEIREWLLGLNRTEAEITAITAGIREGPRQHGASVISFPQFARNYWWLLRTLKTLEEAHDSRMLSPTKIHLPTQEGEGATTPPGVTRQPSSAEGLSNGH